MADRVISETKRGPLINQTAGKSKVDDFADDRRLSRLERAHIAFIRRSLKPGLLDGAIRWCQRRLGATWIHYCTRHLLHFRGLGRLPAFEPEQSYVVVSNHRSFFDMYVITAQLVRRGLRHRIFFPVRSDFFYDTLSGFFVNGVMSFFAMYPPIFRQRQRASLNVASLAEITRLLRAGGCFVGLHPEGTRNKGPDPYTFLSPQRGVGRVIFDARVPVLPVFINGLINNLQRQVTSNFDRTGKPIIVVFGEPLDLTNLWEQGRGPNTDRMVADAVMQAIGRLGEEERRIRAALES
ncbi:MAG TPA: lysophospholipid acyltransferase family protein [Polyangiaceae bacterium]